MRHVAVVTMPVTSPPGSSMPFLVLPGSILCQELYEWFRCAANRGRSGSWRRHQATAVAFMYDHFYATSLSGMEEPANQPGMAANFAERLLFGTIGPDGRDPTGLFWNARSWGQASSLLRAARAFCRYVLEGSPGAVEQPTAFSVRQWLADQAQSANAVLGNLRDPAAWGEDDGEPLPFSRQLASGRSGRPIAFPATLETRFITEAMMPVDGATRSERHLAIRNALFFLLLLYGGLRKSEALQLFLQDVGYDPDTGGAIVHLYHPETGGIPGCRSKRAEYLHVRYGLVPRTRYDVTDGRWAGWKSVLLDEQAPERCPRSRVYWRNQGAGVLFWDLHRAYVAEVRPKDAQHPYYLTNLVGPTRGAPMTFEACDQALVTSLARLDLSPDASAGLALHCMRHGYGQALSQARVMPVVLQVCLHHLAITSQLAYTRPSPGAVSAELERAERHAALGVAGMFDTGRLGISFRSDPMGIFSDASPVVNDETVRRVVRLNASRRAGNNP